MKFNFRKIASVFASVVMLGSTVGIAAAATAYPAPFVAGGAADVAIVYGNAAAFSDGLAAGEIQSSLQFELGKQTASGGSTGTGSISGEATPLFTGSSKIYINDRLNSVKSTVTKADMPNLLAEQAFSGNVDAKTTQTIVVGYTPQITFAKQPTSSDDPLFALATSSSSGVNTYNATVDFNKAVNLSHADSKNQELVMFGQKFMIGAATTATDLVLLKSAEKLNLDSSGTTSQEVTIEGKKYTIEMVSASATAATIKVTNEAGASDQKEVSEGYTKKINGLTIAVNTADTNNLKYTASVVAGAEKITIPVTAGAITYGDSDTVIDGTTGSITGGTTAATKIIVQVRAPNSDGDAIKPGASFTDTVFGTFKVDFAGMNIADSDVTAREDIKIKNSGDDKMLVEMTDARGNAGTFQWAINTTNEMLLQSDSDGHNIRVGEMAAANKSDYIVLGNEDEGRLLKVLTITNQTTGYSSDKVTFQDVFSKESVDATLTGEGVGTVTIGGKVYDVYYYGDASTASEAMYVRVNQPDSSSAKMIVYPTIQTSKGAKVFLYKPLAINLGSFDGLGTITTHIMFPNGAKAYQSITAAPSGTGNVSINSVILTGVAASNSTSVLITGTGLTYNFTMSAANTTTVYLLKNGGGNIVDPALVVLEEKDDNNEYHAVIVTLESGRSSEDGIGVSDITRTWGNDATWNAVSLYSDSKKTKDADLWGTIATIDSSDSDQATATISYPNEQVYAQLYVGAVGSSVTAGTSSGGSVANLGYPVYKDSEVSSVSTKNLIVVGGSCINTVAAKILGSDTAKCSADFTTLAGVGANQALVKVVTSPYSATKVAMLIAGYEAADTTKAAKYVTTEKPATTTDTTTKLSTSSAVATVVTAAA